MADPLSITVGILAIAGACSTSVRLLQSAHAASQELARLEAELDHLGDVVKDIERLNVNNWTASSGLIKNMSRARAKVQQVQDFLQNHFHRGRPGSASTKIRRRDLLRQRSRLKGFAEDLNVTTTRLADCIAITSLSCTLGVPAQAVIADENKPLNVTSEMPTSLQSARPQHQHSPLTESFEMMHIGPNDGPSPQSAAVGTLRHPQTLEGTEVASASWAWRNRQMISLEDVSLQDHLARIYREVGENRRQTKRLTQMFGNHVAVRRTFSHGLSGTEGDEHDNKGDAGYLSSSELSANIESADDEVFSDCVSRFAEDHADAPIDQLRAMFMACQSPDSYFEASSSYFPEQYTSARGLSGTLALVAVADVSWTDTLRLQKYFFNYAQGPRSWRRITVSATFLGAAQRLAFPDTTCQFEIGQTTLPGDLQSQMEKCFRDKHFLETVTEVSLSITQNASGGMAVDATKLDIAEDLEEVSKCDEEGMLQDLEDMGCPQFLESEVVVRSRVGSSAYLVYLGSRCRIERKLPFAGAEPGGDATKSFFNDLKTLYSLRNCDYVAKFMGVVLDDTRKHLRSYLYESPARGSIADIFLCAKADRKRIPWSILENWAKQIVTAVSHVHAKGFVVGTLSSVDSIGIRSDGSAFIKFIRPSAIVHGVEYPDTFFPTRTSFRSDIFRLGYLLWLLAKQTISVRGHSCLWNACNNLINLPSCSSAEVPPYFDVMISNCRQSDPRARMPARELLRLFPPGASTSEAASLARQFPMVDGPWINCDECGELATDLHYHCNICRRSNFDLCSHSVSQGLHCLAPEHQLIKRIYQNGSMVTASKLTANGLAHQDSRSHVLPVD